VKELKEAFYEAVEALDCEIWEEYFASSGLQIKIDDNPVVVKIVVKHPD